MSLDCYHKRIAELKARIKAYDNLGEHEESTRLLKEIQNYENYIKIFEVK